MFPVAIMTFIPDLSDVEKGTSSQTKVQEDETHSHSSASPNNAGGGVSPVSSFGLIVQEVSKSSNYSIICVTLNTELNTVDKRCFGAQTAI